MSKDDWLELTVLEKKKYNYLVEIQDLTRQLAESLDRNDQVSTRMLVAMRQDPIRQLTEVEHSGKLRLTVLAAFPMLAHEIMAALSREKKR